MLKFTVDYSGHPINDEFHRACTAAEKVLAVQVMKDTAPYVPASQAKSLVNRTHIENGNVIVYPGPYARYLWFGKYMVDEQGRGPFPTVNGPRYHVGARLHEVPERDLVISKAVNPKATSHWTEVSKRANIGKWMNVAAKAVQNGLG